MTTYDWESIPDIHEVRDTLLNQADCRTRLKIAKLELEIFQAEMAQCKPRDPSVRIVGIDADTRAKLATLFQNVLNAEEALSHVDAEVKFNNHRIDSAKALMYRNKI